MLVSAANKASALGHFCAFGRIVIIIVIFTYLGDAVALLIAHQTCDLQVAGSSPGWAPLRSGLGQATYICVPLSPSSIICYWPMK